MSLESFTHQWFELYYIMIGKLFQINLIKFLSLALPHCFHSTNLDLDQ